MPIKTGFNVINFQFNIRGNLSILRCVKKRILGKVASDKVEFRGFYKKVIDSFLQFLG